jgi:hypothetical protein
MSSGTRGYDLLEADAVGGALRQSHAEGAILSRPKQLRTVEHGRWNPATMHKADDWTDEHRLWSPVYADQ